MKTFARLLVTVLTVVMATALQARSAFASTEFYAIVVQDIPFTGPDGPAGLTLVGVTATGWAHAVPDPSVENPYNQETFAQIDADGGVTCLWWVPWGSCYYSDTASGTGTADDGSYFSLTWEQNDFDPIYVTIHGTFDIAAHWNVSSLAYMTFWGPIYGDYFQPSDYQYGYGFGWITGAAVEVGSLQYKIGTGSWAGVSGVITVPQGTTVSFQAIPKPADAGWPSGKPAWNPSSEVTFDTASTSATNYQDVSAECGNTVTAHVLVVGVDKIVVDGSTSEDEKPVYTVPGYPVILRAKPKPSDLSFPSGNPVWSLTSGPTGSSLTVSGTGATKSVTPDILGTYVVRATCGTSYKEISIIACQVDISLDTNNDGAIDGYGSVEDSYEGNCVGRIITIGDPLEVSGDPTKCDVAEIQLKILPEDIPLDMGWVCLDVASTNCNLQLWEDRNMTQPIALPIYWDTAIMPSKVYASVVPFTETTCYETNSLRIELYAGDSQFLTSDTTNITAIGPIARTPNRTEVMIWEATPWQLFSTGTDEFVSKVAMNGWANVQYFRDSDHDNNVHSNTVANFRNIANSGIMYIWGHGGPLTAACFADTSATSQAAAEEWRTGYDDQDFHIIIFGAVDSYICLTTQHFMDTYWKPVTTANRTFVVLAGCATSGAASHVGGRVVFSYSGELNDPDQKFNNNILFGNIVGQWGDGRWRSAGQAYGDGSNFRDGLSISGNPLTTLAPAPVYGIPHFAPLGIVGASTAGGALFDTYIDTNHATGNVVVRDSGGTITTPRWMSSPLGTYGLSFDFTRPAGTTISLHVTASECEASSSHMRLCGDRKTYNTNESWTIP